MIDTAEKGNIRNIFLNFKLGEGDVKMVGSLVRLKTDPNKLGRGAGVYYHRGKGYYSKYDPKRDMKIKAKGFNIHKIGLPSMSKILHTSDGKLPR